MPEQNITIPAGMNGGSRDWTAERLRNYASALRLGGYPTGAGLLDFLADEIERQAPRKVGWYSVRYDKQRFLRYWHGDGWGFDEDATSDLALPCGENKAIIEPVTFGAPS